MTRPITIVGTPGRSSPRRRRKVLRAFRPAYGSRRSGSQGGLRDGAQRVLEKDHETIKDILGQLEQTTEGEGKKRDDLFARL
jgi:hypothetical protein